MRWFGSKSSVVSAIYAFAMGRSRVSSICDPFGGIGVVGAYFKSHGFSVTTGDHLFAPHCFQTATVAASRTPSFRQLCRSLRLGDVRDVVDHLNGLKHQDGWLVREYSVNRGFFERSNAQRIEACRVAILDWANKGLVSPLEHRILLASLLNSMDRVANTAGTYYAYLKKWHRKALNPFIFSLLPPTRGTQRCRSVLADAADLVGDDKYDILYLDPPFNQRSYANYYHLPETIARSEEPPVFGAAGVPQSIRPRSDFNRPRYALDALANLLERAKFRNVILHYANDGIIRPTEISEVLSPYGRIERMRLNATGYSTQVGVHRTVSHVLYAVRRA